MRDRDLSAFVLYASTAEAALPLAAARRSTVCRAVFSIHLAWITA
jgi:hypothetical protein